MSSGDKNHLQLLSKFTAANPGLATFYIVYNQNVHNWYTGEGNCHTIGKYFHYYIVSAKFIEYQLELTIKISEIIQFRAPSIFGL